MASSKLISVGRPPANKASEDAHAKVVSAIELLQAAEISFNLGDDYVAASRVAHCRFILNDLKAK